MFLNIISPQSTEVQINNFGCFRPRFCTAKAIQGRGQPGLMRRILLRIMPLVQDGSLDLLTSSPARYHCTTDTPIEVQKIPP